MEIFKKLTVGYKQVDRSRVSKTEQIVSRKSQIENFPTNFMFLRIAIHHVLSKTENVMRGLSRKNFTVKCFAFERLVTMNGCWETHTVFLGTFG